MPGPDHQVGCNLGFELQEPSLLAMQIAPSLRSGSLIDETVEVRLGGAPLATPVMERATAHGGRVHLIEAGAGSLTISYSATVRPSAPGATATQTGGDQGQLGWLDDEAMVALRQSRYCPSDRLAGFANVEFGEFAGRDDLAQAVASWVFERLAYAPGSTDPFDTAVDTLLTGHGVCRDFAHLTIALCRALGIPARLVAVYAPGVSPMDFHAVVEVRRPHGWEILDPTRLAPRQSMLRIATGRDAADTALASTIFGNAEMVTSEVFAIVDGDLPLDDHIERVILA